MKNPETCDWYAHLSQEGALPTHWGYSDEWFRGFPLWVNLADAVNALLGFDRDGSYTAREYPVTLLVCVDEIEDAPSLFIEAQREAVQEVRSLPSREITQWVRAQARRAQQDVDDWVDANVEAIERFIFSRARRIRPIWIDPR